MSLIEQIKQADVFTVSWKVLFAARFEITFVIVLASLYAMILRVRSKASRERFAPKKQRVSRRTSLATEREEPSRVKKRDSAEGATASEGSVALGARELDAILVKRDPTYVALLTDPAWVIPRIADTCHTDAQQALSVYREAMHVGLKLDAAPLKGQQQLFTALATSMIKSNRIADARKLLQEMQARGCAVPLTLRTSVVKLCTARQAFQEALALYDMLPVSDQDAASQAMDKTIWSCLLFCSIEAKAFHRCQDFFARLKENGVPSQRDYWNMVRLASAQGDWKAIQELIREMHECNLEVDNVIYNTALASCVAAGQVVHARELLEEMETLGTGVSDVITYNTIMKGYAKIGKMDDCFMLYELMCKRGHTPSPVTYGILLDGYINDNDVQNAAKIFETMQNIGCPMNTVLYTTLIKGFAREGKVDDAMRLYEQMVGQSGVTPDLVTFSTLLKANCDADQMEKALGLLADMVKSGLRPDEVIFNNLLAGCAVSSKIELAKRIYNDMIESGVKPSNATFSILIRVYSTCNLLEEAATMLKTEPLKHHVATEVRLYVQLITSCIRARQGRRAVEVCELMHERSIPTPASMSTILSASTKLNMYDTAVDFMACTAKHRGRIDARDANMVLQNARKKKKDACVESCLAAMEIMGLAVHA